MNLLLLLSALLTALTGAVTGVRASEPATAICAQVRQVECGHQAGAAVTLRPAASLPTLAAVAWGQALPAVAMLSPPAYASRRRE